MRNITSIKAVIISRTSYQKKDYFEAFTKEYGKINLQLSLRIRYFRRVDESDFCELDVVNREQDTWVICGIHSIKTFKKLRQNTFCYALWCVASEVIRKSLGYEVPYPDLFQSLLRFLAGPNHFTLKNLLSCSAIEHGISDSSTDTYQSIRALEKGLDIQVLSYGELQNFNDLIETT
ncbi:MAG: hypothetical protein N2654_02195 [Deltaproteobacteria bacterium]|nr:hypothetical protein [Deltaproteobacteria bacterium]